MQIRKRYPLSNWLLHMKTQVADVLCYQYQVNTTSREQQHEKNTKNAFGQGVNLRDLFINQKKVSQSKYPLYFLAASSFCVFSFHATCQPTTVPCSLCHCSMLHIR